MKNYPKPTVGQKLFCLNVGNAARNVPQVLTPVIVTSVGRKYFTTKTEEKYPRNIDYHLDTWQEKTQFSKNSHLYLTEQEWLDETETQNICDEISHSFHYGKNGKNLPLATLRQIKQLIDSVDKSSNVIP